MKEMSRRDFALMTAGTFAATALGSNAWASTTSSGRAADDPTGWTLTEAAAAIRNGSITSVRLTQTLLDRIAIYNPKVNAYVTVSRERALDQAKSLDLEQKSGQLRGALHGVPVALKDNIDTAGTRTTAASAVFEDRIPTEDAEVVRRLRSAGAVIIGKLNLHEFALGATGDVSYFGPTRNPWALDRVTGGSSSGCGAALATALCYGALGTDTGGSVRIPASWCGISGLKPTYGLVPIRGIIPAVRSLDHCGPMARSVDDLALMLTVLAGYDELDNVSVDHPKEDYARRMRQPVNSIRLGVPPEFYDNLDPEVARAVNEAIEVLSKVTAGVTAHGGLPAGDMGTLLGLGEIYAYHEPYLKSSIMSYRPPTRRFIESQKDASLVDYIRGRGRLETLRRTIDDCFTSFDLVVLPTQRQLPPKISTSLAQEMNTGTPTVYGHDAYETIANTIPFDVYGLPALSIPCGFSASGLPIGLTIAGPRFSEAKVLAVGRAFERATDWHTRTAPLTPDTPVPPISEG